ncbi:MAG: DeoR/GlpR family DNA-binding transcription regulator [bacterium]
MLALERHRKLIECLNARGSVRTAKVATELGVTEETVRRDFERLETEGQLVRTHGGALRLDASRREFPMRERMAQNASAKARIARAALAHLREGCSMYFDASTTVLQLAAVLPDKPFTVITNSLQAALSLTEKTNVTVYLLGGRIAQSSLSCTGWAAIQGLEMNRIDVAFLSCRGLHPALGLSDATEEQAELKRQVVLRASEVVLLADHTKAGLSSSFFFAKNADVDFWITDALPQDDVRDAVTSQGVRLEVAE